jgi:hypothetical protein
METHDILDTISKIRNHDMYLNHTSVIHMYCDFPTMLQLVRSMGSLDVPLGPAPSCRSFVVLGTKHLLIFACVRLAGPSVSILYARFGSSSSDQGAFLFLDCVAQVESLFLLSSIFPSTLTRSTAMRCEEKWVHGHLGL